MRCASALKGAVMEPGRAQVLVADDCPMMRRALCRVLRGAGFEALTEAEDGLAALALFHERAFDLVISDWNMPGATGLELLERIRQHTSRGLTPVILLTGLGTAERARRAVEAGASGFLGKPFSDALLVGRALALVTAASRSEAEPVALA